MSKFYLIIFALFITCYEPIKGDDTGNGPNELAPTGQVPNGEEQQADAISSMKQTVLDVINQQPQLYDADDVNQFLNDSTGFSSIRYLNQRSYNWRRAAQLAVKNLRWRAKMGLNQLTAAMFPCELFKLGLIFEQGTSNQLFDQSGSSIGGTPVIWIRLGALGNVIKHMEKFTSKRVVSYAYSSARNIEYKAKGFLRKHLLGVQQPVLEKAPIVEDMSLKNDQTISYILSAITWFLNDWEQSHPPGSKATLVLDFENTDFAFTSWSMGEFFVGLDDNFPDLFDQIIGFRYKAKLWSLHSPISMFNRIFKSRISSSPETDSKLKFVNHEQQLNEYITRVDHEGYSLLPMYIHGDCYGPIGQAPAGCQADATSLAASQMYNPSLLEAVSNEFYQVCKPRNRV